jgi:uncharacterized protein with HEPN domain
VIYILEHIVKYCDEIDDGIKQFGNTVQSLQLNIHYKNSMAMCVLQIGELTTHLSEDFKISHSEVPWKAIKDMRNVAAHRYHTFGIEELFKTITEDIPNLQVFCNILTDEYRLKEVSAPSPMRSR